MSPELELLLTLAGSAFMFNMSNQLFKSVNNSLNDPMKSLRESIKSAFNQTQQTTVPGGNSASTNGISFSVPTFQNINGLNATNATNNPNNSFHNNLNNIQLETLKQQQTQKRPEMENVDDDRFSISSSTDSIFEQQTQQNHSNKNVTSKKPRNGKKVVAQRTLVI